MNNQKDFLIAREKLWYRIPVKSAPINIKDGKAKLISFYHTSALDKEKFTIRWFGEIQKISIVKREELFPNETKNPKSDKEYYKVEFSKLRQLPLPIISIRPRRILFIPTTEEKFFGSKEINFLFNNSSLENKLWNALLRMNVYPEREYAISVSNNYFFLDFAIFCKNRNIDIETDGDIFHMNPESVQNDKRRNNLLESKGWSVLRFTSNDITDNMSHTLDIVRETVNHYGGAQDLKDTSVFSYLDNGLAQKRLFE